MTNWKIEQHDDYTTLTLDCQDRGQNVLSAAVMEELAEQINELKKSPPDVLVLTSGKSSGFIAGADVSEFSKVTDEAAALAHVQSAHEVINSLADLPSLKIARINGHCLGGGLELALACDYLVADNDPSNRIGLPEVLLGIHPGFGGTARSIARIGVPAAMDLMLSGRTVVPKVAKRMGLIDQAVPARQLDNTVRFLIKKRPSKKKLPWWHNSFAMKPARSVLAKVLRKKVAERARPEHYPAPFALIDLWEDHGGKKERMLQNEQQSVAKLVTTPTSRNLVSVFFQQEALKRGDDVSTDTNLPEVNHVHVIGAGVMGGDIAAWCAMRGIQVTLGDLNADALAKARQRAAKLFKRKLREARLVQAALDRMQPDLAGNGIGRADVIIEAIVEKLEIKQKVLADVESKAKSSAIIASNTSSIAIEAIAEGLQQPERLVGIHFFNPVAKMQLVEIVRGKQSADSIIGRAMAFTRQISRLPIEVMSSPGFLVNRVLTPYLLEAVSLYEEGVPAAVIDEIAERFGMPMGPITLADTVGLDICQHVANNLDDLIPGELPKRLDGLIAEGNLGKKTGKGIYQWKAGKPQREAAALPDNAQRIEDRLVMRYLNECVTCLDENLVVQPELLDGGLIFGTGFAPFTGGPIRYIRNQGVTEMLQRLQSLHEEYGERFTPAKGWSDLA